MQAPDRVRSRPRGVAALRWVVSVQAVLLFLQAAFAGQFLSGNDGWRDWHAANGELLPLLSLAQLVIAVVVWRRRGPAWPAALSGVQLLAVGTQLGLGYAGQVAVHVPLGVAIFGLTVWLLVGVHRLAARPP
jgi:hypothetical protein